MIAQIAVFSRKTDVQRKKKFAFCFAKICAKVLLMETLKGTLVFFDIFETVFYQSLCFSLIREIYIFPSLLVLFNMSRRDDLTDPNTVPEKMPL